MRLEGFEPPTLGSVDRCSNPLSYSRLLVITGISMAYHPTPADLPRNCPETPGKCRHGLPRANPRRLSILLLHWNYQGRKEWMAKSKWITMKELEKELGESRSTIDKWRSRGLCPRPIKLPNGHLRFDVDEVYAWLDDLTVAN